MGTDDVRRRTLPSQRGSHGSRGHIGPGSVRESGKIESRSGEARWSSLDGKRGLDVVEGSKNLTASLAAEE